MNPTEKSLRQASELVTRFGVPISSHPSLGHYIALAIDAAKAAQREEDAAQLAALQKELDELQAVFDTRWKADMRALKLHQQRTGMDEDKWPDRCDMVVELLKYVDAVTAERDELAARCAAMVEATKECLAVVDECYTATGHSKVAETSVQREKINGALANLPARSAAMLAVVEAAKETRKRERVEIVITAFRIIEAYTKLEKVAELLTKQDAAVDALLSLDGKGGK